MTQPGFPPSGNMVNFQPPSYNPLAGPGFTSNPLFQLAMSMYLPQTMGQGNFLPSLMPAQHLFDQFTAAKYQNARMQGMAGVQAIDQQALTTRMLGVQAAVSDSPMTAMNVEQASNMASIANHPLAKMIVGQLMGPENMEDLYYGRRGSAEMMYQSVAKSGFHRRDPTGGERMSAESLSGMTREMYAQMYGPDADIAEMNGVSAGRAGVLYDDLFRRGVLPQSVGNLTPAERVKTIARDLPTDDKTLDRLSREYAHEQLMRSDPKLVDDKRYSELTPQQQRAHVEMRLPEDRKTLKGQLQDIRDYNAGTGQKSIGEIEQMDGFGIAARSIDAQKVTSTLKGYSGAIAAVREIFGDNGNPNAPMQQLLTALEALTQNQIGRVSPKKIEQQVREMQLAARGAGVGIGGMLALSSQAAAFGDQLGLDRSFATTSAMAGMRQGEAMRNAGAINRGFGGMSQEEAMVKGAFLESAAAASPIGNMIGVAVRTVKENPAKHYKADGTAITPIGAMVQALERGETTYKDPKTGKMVDIQQGIADKQSAFIRDELDKTEDKRLTEARMLDAQGNQEFTSYVKDISRITQRADIVGDLGATFNNQLSLEGKGFGDQARREIGQATAEAALATHSGIAPEERAAHMREQIMQNLIKKEEAKLAQTRPGDTPEVRRKEAEKRASATFDRAFGATHEEQMTSMGIMLSEANRMLAAIGESAGMTMFNLKDFYGADVQENKARAQAQQTRRAELMGDFGDTQSTMLQRFSDVLGGLGSGKKTTVQQAVQAMLGIIPNSQISDAMRPGAAALFQLAGEEYRRGIIASEEELISLRQTAEGSDSQAAAEAKEKLRKFAGEKGKGIEDVQTLFQAAVDQSANKKVAGGERNIGLSRDIIRGLELGGSAGVSRASGALAQSLLGVSVEELTQARKRGDKTYVNPATGEQIDIEQGLQKVNTLAEALRSGDEKKVTALLPASITGDQSDAGKQRMKQILVAADTLKRVDDSGRGWGVMDSQKIGEARLRTVRDVVASGDKTILETTEKGRRLVAMSTANAQGDYTFDGKKYNAYTDLGGGETADAEKFKNDLQEVADKADQKTKDKIDTVLKQGAADPAKQAAAAAQTVQQAAGGVGALGGISSATITIQRLEHLHVQNATGLQMPAGSAGRVTGSADTPAPQTPTSVAAAEAQKADKKKDGLFSSFTAAMTNLGKVATIGNVPLQDIISGAAKLAPDLQKQATDFLTKAYEAATAVNATTKPRTGTKPAGEKEQPAQSQPNPETKREMWEKLSAKERQQVSFIRNTDEAKKSETAGDDYTANIKRKAADNALQGIAMQEIAEENPGQPIDQERVKQRVDSLRETIKLTSPDAIISERAQSFVDYERGKPAAATGTVDKDPAQPQTGAKQTAAPVDFDKWHGKAFKIVTTPPGMSVKSHTDGTPVANEPGQVSIVTPENGAAWNWPDAPAETVNNFRQNWESIQGGIGGYKMSQIQRAMIAQTSFDKLTPSQQAEVEFLQAEQERAAAQTTLKDSNATPEQKAAAEKTQKQKAEIDRAASVTPQATDTERKYDIDPKEFTQSATQADGVYSSIRSGAFRDRDGKPIKRPTDSPYFDAIHTIKRAKDDRQHRTGRVGQIGDKYYEEYKAGGVAIAYREVTVGSNDSKSQTAARTQKDEINQAAKETQKLETEKSAAADDARKQVTQTTQTAALKKLEELDTAMQQSFDELKPSQKKEVEYLQATKSVNEAQGVLEDPDATLDKKAEASKTVAKNQKDVEKIVAMKMMEEAGIKTDGDFNVEVTGSGKDHLTTSVKANGRKLDQFEFLARVKQYNADNNLHGVSDEAITHMGRVQQKEAQEGFVQSQEQQAVDGTQDQKQTDEKQQQASSKAETKQREVTLSVPTVEERKEAQAEIDRTEVAKQVVTAEQQSGRLTAAGGAGAGSGGGEQEITGTLQLRGLTEVLLNARGKQMEQPEGGGAAVDPAQGQGGYVTAIGQ